MQKHEIKNRRDGQKIKLKKPTRKGTRTEKCNEDQLCIGHPRDTRQLYA